MCDVDAPHFRPQFGPPPPRFPLLSLHVPFTPPPCPHVTEFSSQTFPLSLPGYFPFCFFRSPAPASPPPVSPSPPSVVVRRDPDLLSPRSRALLIGRSRGGGGTGRGQGRGCAKGALSIVEIAGQGRSGEHSTKYTIPRWNPPDRDRHRQSHLYAGMGKGKVRDHTHAARREKIGFVRGRGKLWKPKRCGVWGQLTRTVSLTAGTFTSQPSRSAAILKPWLADPKTMGLAGALPPPRRLHNTTTAKGGSNSTSRQMLGSKPEQRSANALMAVATQKGSGERNSSKRSRDMPVMGTFLVQTWAG